MCRRRRSCWLRYRALRRRGGRPSGGRYPQGTGLKLAILSTILLAVCHWSSVMPAGLISVFSENIVVYNGLTGCPSKKTPGTPSWSWSSQGWCLFRHPDYKRRRRRCSSDTHLLGLSNSKPFIESKIPWHSKSSGDLALRYSRQCKPRSAASRVRGMRLNIWSVICGPSNKLTTSTNSLLCCPTEMLWWKISSGLSACTIWSHKRTPLNQRISDVITPEPIMVRDPSYMVSLNYSIRAQANVVARSICLVLHISLVISPELFLVGSYIAKFVFDPSECLGRFQGHEHLDIRLKWSEHSNRANSRVH